MPDGRNVSTHHKCIKLIFIIWIGEKCIPQKYLPRIQSIFINAYIRGYKCIIYTDNIFKMTKTLIMSDYVHMLISICEIKSINILIDISETLENQCDWSVDTFNNKSKYFKFNIAESTLAQCPSYLGSLRFLINHRFYARASLNLRIIALNIHGGIYVDADCMNEYYKNLYQMCDEYKSQFYIYNQLIKYKEKISMGHPVKHFRRFESTYLLSKLSLPRCTNMLKQCWSVITCIIDIDMYIRIFKTSKLYKKWYEQDTSTSDISQLISYQMGQCAEVDKLEVITFGISNFGTKNASQCILRLDRPGILTKSLIIYYQFIKLVYRIQTDYAYHSDIISSVCIPKSPNGSLNGSTLNIIYTRKLYPYYVTSSDNIKVTYRRGIFHPLGKAVTRGGWDFIKKQSLKIVSQPHINTRHSDLSSNIAYGNGVEYDFGNIYPESSVITGDYKHNPNHWSKQFY